MRLTVEAQFKRCGHAVQVVVPAASHQEIHPRPNLPLIRAIARARCWYEKLISGKIKFLNEIARETRLDKRYINRVLRCAFLSDIADSILEGRRPPEFTLDQILYHLPTDWAKQRRVLGFTS